MSRGNLMETARKIVSAEKGERISPRERILAAASDLFYRCGIRAVGVDAIAEAAETNKMTLYRHFPSKDELVAEYLRRMAKESERAWEERAAAHPGGPCAQLRAWLNDMADRTASGSERGCPFANTAVEFPEKDHPARAVIEAYKTAQRERLAALSAAAGLTEPDMLA